MKRLIKDSEKIDLDNRLEEMNEIISTNKDFSEEETNSNIMFIYSILDETEIKSYTLEDIHLINAFFNVLLYFCNELNLVRKVICLEHTKSILESYSKIDEVSIFGRRQLEKLFSEYVSEVYTEFCQEYVRIRKEFK